MDKLKDLYSWFDDNRDNIIEGHKNQFALLANDKVIDYYPNMEAALTGAQKNNLTVGSFLIQRCITKEDDTLVYHNMAVTFG
ncbi:hypothetical protein IZU27_02815 [Treponema socranskii]|uniref:hypothetical protein n=1 Tax=Treponema socranskii TaxID=53419 RepID=UPI003D940A28